MTDTIRPKILASDATNLIYALREISNFAGLTTLNETHVKVATAFANRLEILLAYQKARETVKALTESQGSVDSDTSNDASVDDNKNL